MVSIAYQIKNEEGLHARPAADFCNAASKFQSKISLITDGNDSEATRRLMVLCVGAENGDVIELRAEGEDEQEAIDTLVKTLDMAE